MECSLQILKREHLSSVLVLQQIQRMQESSGSGASLDLFKAAEGAHLPYSLDSNVPPSIHTSRSGNDCGLYVHYILLSAGPLNKSEESVKHLLTVKDTVVIRWLCFGVVAWGPEPSVLQPERGPDGVDHTQASRQPHTGLGDPEAADAVTQLQ